MRGFGASNLATATALMPFVGYLILYNSELSTMLGGLGGLLEEQPSAQLCPASLSFFAKLNLVYLGLFTLGIAALVFKIAAPRELKLYKDANDFIERERPNLTARRVRSMYRTINHRRPRIGSELRQRATWLDESVVIAKASTEFVGNKNEDVVLDLMRSFFQAQDRHYRRAEVVVCLVCFLVGSLLLAVPSSAFTFRVFCTILSS